MEKTLTRGAERPVEVASGDMMALRPVGATIGPADLARRAAPRSGRFARREIVAEQNCDFAAAPARAGGTFDAAASHRARKVSPLRISPEGRGVARLAGG